MRSSAAEWHNAALEHLRSSQPITMQAQKDDVIREPITLQKDDVIVGKPIGGKLSQKESELHRLDLASPSKQPLKKINILTAGDRKVGFL